MIQLLPEKVYSLFTKSNREATQRPQILTLLYTRFGEGPERKWMVVLVSQAFTVCQNWSKPLFFITVL